MRYINRLFTYLLTCLMLKNVMTLRGHSAALLFSFHTYETSFIAFVASFTIALY